MASYFAEQPRVLIKQEMVSINRYQLDNMQIICISIQTAPFC